MSTTALFVIKKNKSRLESLIAWLDNSRDARQGRIEQSLLLIDDEADNASINTNDPDENPTAINGCIPRLLKLFRQTTYSGITATPFANIFINPSSEDDMLGDDLFPRDFIYSLDVPDSYIGPDKIFGDESGKMLIHVSRFTNVQRKVHRRVAHWLDQVSSGSATAAANIRSIIESTSKRRA